MLLSEATQILKNNGYRLVEVYDAVTDRNNIKDKKSKFKNYYTYLMKRLKFALADEGIEAKLVDKDHLRIGHFMVYYYDYDWREGTVGEPNSRGARSKSGYGDTCFGPESKKLASYKSYEQNVSLIMFSKGKHIAAADFDVRNTPSMVQWIISNIE